MPLRTYGNKRDRRYRDLDRLVRLIRDSYGFKGCITLFEQGDPKLQRYAALDPADSVGWEAAADPSDGVPPCDPHRSWPPFVE